MIRTIIAFDNRAAAFIPVGELKVALFVKLSQHREMQ